MSEPHNIMIHEFEVSGTPIHYDDDGDQMLGFYFQFTDENDQPISNMIGPYSYSRLAERAAIKAFNSKDF